MVVFSTRRILQVLAEERDELSYREVALGPAADLRHQLVERQGAVVVSLERFAEDDGVDRRQPEIGEEARVFVDRAWGLHPEVALQEQDDLAEDGGSGWRGHHGSAPSPRVQAQA